MNAFFSLIQDSSNSGNVHTGTVMYDLRWRWKKYIYVVVQNNCFWELRRTFTVPAIYKMNTYKFSIYTLTGNIIRFSLLVP